MNRPDWSKLSRKSLLEPGRHIIRDRTKKRNSRKNETMYHDVDSDSQPVYFQTQKSTASFKWLASKNSARQPSVQGETWRARWAIARFAAVVVIAPTKNNTQRRQKRRSIIYKQHLQTCTSEKLENKCKEEKRACAIAERKRTKGEEEERTKGEEEEQRRKRIIFRRRMTDGGVEAKAGRDWPRAGCGQISWD